MGWGYFFVVAMKIALSFISPLPKGRDPLNDDKEYISSLMNPILIIDRESDMKGGLRSGEWGGVWGEILGKIGNWEIFTPHWLLNHLQTPTDYH